MAGVMGRHFLLHLHGLDSLKHVVEYGHVVDEGVRVTVGVVKEPDAGQVTLDCLVFEALLPKELNELTQNVLLCGEWLRAKAGARISVSTEASYKYRNAVCSWRDRTEDRIEHAPSRWRGPVWFLVNQESRRN